MERGIPDVSVPEATYRFQFNKHFTFRAASLVIPYLAELGISHIYASPYLKAAPGSLHGYDIVDHNSLNPEVGDEQDFTEYLASLEQQGMNQILDIVPNHMCVESSENAWWQDVLENGVASAHAGSFDINWSPIKRELTNKVLLPVLGAQFGAILENKELCLVYREGSFYICYYDHRFPLSPTSLPAILSHRLDDVEQTDANREDFDELLSIIAAFARLPSGLDETVLLERFREKEVAKRRLWKLYTNSPLIREFLDENIAIFNGKQGEPASFTFLELLLLQQSFRIAYWRVATEEINYRRFFDINALGAIRVELTSVFNDVHSFILDLIERGRVTGFRVDHADGLYNPAKYFHQLQLACFLKIRLRQNSEDAGATEPEASRHEGVQAYQKLLETNPDFKVFYLLAEKILLRKETIPREWKINGDTGYSFIDAFNTLCVNSENLELFDTFYRTFTGMQHSFQTVLYEKKKLVLYSSMASEINILGSHLSTLAENNRHTRDFTLYSMVKALVEVIAYFPVYRTYTNSLQTDETDREQVNHAIERAQKRSRGIDPSVFRFIQDVLTLRFYDNMQDEHKFQWLDFVMRFQQLTGPAMAKGMEDTTFYVYNRLISLNEVGGNPDTFGRSISEFHALNRERAENAPHAMLASTTHDTKRSEDVRARINVLTEIPEEWIGAVTRWSRSNRRHKKMVESILVPNANKEYHLYQTLVGAWPLDSEDPEIFESFVARIQEYMRKALREGKETTSWINPNEPYEMGIQSFIDEVLSDRSFRDDMKLFLEPVALCGMYSSLAMTLLKMTSPGVPDFYQGSELWDFRLVDPDNRQAVDYEKRASMLRQLRAMEAEQGTKAVAEDVAGNLHDSRIKLFLIHKVLQFRKSHTRLFRNGAYTPLEFSKENSNVCAFSRAEEDEEALVVAPRFFSSLTGNGRKPPYGTGTWGDSYISVPGEGTYRNILTDQVLINSAGRLLLADIFTFFPVALLEKVQPENAAAFREEA